MGILGITNRTENWKTAQTFAPFIGNQFALRLLAGQLLDDPLDHEEEVNLELFWTGGRDYLDAADTKPEPRDLADAYDHYFRDLRDEIVKFQGDSSKTFRSLQPHNYRVDGENAKKLLDHFKNTEFDIVLETSEHLFIGEAKDESGFGTDGNLVLVHQLIRQYVIAQILARLVAEDRDERPKSIVPFVVAPEGKKLASLRNTAQIKFMIDQKYLKESNILSWGS